ncbi:DEAD/DEAH box helicase [Arthrobacter sp. HLT1-21]
MAVQNEWARPDSALGRFIASETESALAAYRARPDLIREHSNIEAAISQSGYGRKQLHELIQNAADAVSVQGGRIEIVLTDEALYCANEGNPFTEAGYRTLMLSHSSEKRDDQIGRFGLGFKSVIQISSAPMIFSKTGSIAWSQTRSREMLENIYPDLESYPLLRIAEPVDITTAAASDPTLAELQEWASTIVKLPLVGYFRWLSEEMEAFPPEFLLFSPKITSIDFVDKIQSQEKSWKAFRNGTQVVLTDGHVRDSWKIFRAIHEVSATAAVEAGSIAARNEIELTWAVPEGGNPRRKMGRFWNYFPTQHLTSLRGIVNAAFKMNEDRHSMLEIGYNREILTRALPRMVAAALPQLTTSEDPGAYLDILPSRAKEKENWADGTINTPIFKAIAAVPALPDRSGKLRSIGDLKVQPALDEATKLTGLWDAAVGRDRPWLHETALARGRDAQVARLLLEANRKRASIEEWLEEVAIGGTLQDFENALEIASMMEKSHPDYREKVRRSRIVLMADGSVEAPITSRVFLPLDEGDETANLVSYELLHHGETSKYLRSLDLQAQDGRGRINRVAREVGEDQDNIQLAESLWRLTRSLPVPETFAILKERTLPERILVRCRDSKWRPLASVWLPGPLITGNTSGDEHLLLDDRFHSHDVALLRMLRIPAGLPEAEMCKAGGTYNLWKSAESVRLAEETRDSPAPTSPAGLAFPKALATEGLDRLASASIATRARVTKLLLTRPHYPAKVEFSSSYRAALSIDGPDLWWVKQYGSLETSLGLVDTKQCTGQINGVPQAYIPFAGDEEARALGLHTDITRVNWSYVLPLVEKRLPIEKVHELYGLLAKNGVKAPKELLVQLPNQTSTRYLTKHVQVAMDSKSFSHLRSAGEAVIHTGHRDLDDALAENWALSLREIVFSTELTFKLSDEVPPALLSVHYPFLKRVASETKPQTTCTPCLSIEEVQTNSFDSRTQVVPKEWHLEQNVLYYRVGQGERPRVETVLAAFDSKRAPSSVISNMAALKTEFEAQERRERVSRQKTDAGKVAELVGRPTLKALIPQSVLDLLANRGQELTDQRMFDIVSNLHGSSLLKVLKPALEEAGIQTPDQFRGSRSAREFVRDLGFSPEMAGESIRKKPEREEFVGPIRMNPLHVYQESTSRKITELLAGRTKSTRGLVQLPTGAGKTRVAVESVVRHLVSTSEKKLVVWIAQSEELCEQAIETWSYVWQAAGPPGERMAVSRLWGGNSAVPEDAKLHLVIATIQTLASIVESRRLVYDWMSDPDLVIIDEAHGAIATSYTPVLTWFGRSYTDKSKLLLGLSATPYRGSDEKETDRLVNRFGRNLIEPDEFGAAGAHEYLQELGVLANVKHAELNGIELQLRDIRSAKDQDVQTAMLEARLDLQQVAGSSARNEVILDHLTNQQASGPTLVFAASVEHAEALAAVLSVEGISAAAISGKTDLSHRRSIIEDFRRGKIQVLTNFDVLSQGFDAPKVDAVYVCRPTFSPNKYIQMIGRGLRGPLNGGSEEVLIVNVKDNLDQYGTELAFTKFDYLWNREALSAR